MTVVRSYNNDACDSTPMPGARITDTVGRAAKIVSVRQAGPEPTALIRIERGPEVVLPTSLLEPQQDGSYLVPFAFLASSEDLRGRSPGIPVGHDELKIGVGALDAESGVKVYRTFFEREQVVDQPLMHDELLIEHVPIGEIVAECNRPGIHFEGETLVMPVFEEVLVVEKRLRLKEEVRVTRRRSEAHQPQTVCLRSEQVSIERPAGADELSGRESAGDSLSAEARPDQPPPPHN